MATRKQKSRHSRPKAATKDILGVNNGERSVPAKWKPALHRLTALRNTLLARKDALGKTAQEETSNFSMHMADAATDAFDRDFALGTLSSEQDVLYEIDQAINRIHNGTYGICEMTGKKIEPARLEAVPWARFTAEAERKLEKDGEVNHSRLGARNSMAGLENLEPEDEEEAEEPSA